ncbi:hypothetical protein OSB04_031984 [Centaurea solstitialis]|uniref:Water stress and hypersensitive response domain-containing protein n=1 Tax=Centaurea solstitialis TaxID=347529 RepID=A0AA38SNR6_9ASTR|nr:hypothetical protein OSB04_031984 [Centaurea solstitialis]
MDHFHYKYHASSFNLSKSNIHLVKQAYFFTFSNCYRQTFAKDMAGLLDKAKQFVSDTVASLEKPEATVKNVDLKGVDWSTVTYNAEVNVSNPYSVSVPIGEIRYNLKSSGSVIASGKVPDPGSLNGNCDTLLNVEIKVPHNVLVSLVKDIATDWDLDYELEVILVVDLPLIGDISIPVTSKGEVKLPSLSDYFNKSE